MSTKHPQFTLDLDRPADLSPSAFARSPANEAAVRMVEQWPDWSGPVVAIVGTAYSGKSHLGEIWKHRAHAREVALASLSNADIEGGLQEPLWIDRADDAPFDEDALFHALNLAREEKGSILITARSAPSKWKVALPDLGSRLNAVPVVEIAAPDDTLIEAILVKRFADLGLDADPAVLRFLLARMERSYAALGAVVEAFGRRTLAAHRRASVPLAAEVLAEIGGSDRHSE
jgi:chromosomal replication initiation ATPase DnaA